MLRLLMAAGVVVAVTSVCSAVGWVSTFDSDADGVVDIFDNNSGKVMIGPVTSGRLQIEAWDNTTSAYTPDKAGRPLGETLGSTDSFSGTYEFNWSTLNQDETQAFEAVGFLGSTASPQTRQIVGSVLRHWKAGNDYYVGLDVGFGSVGYTGFGYLAGGATWLGTNPTANDYRLEIDYDASTTTLSLALYEAPNILKASNSANLTTLTSAQEVAAMAVDHLGWSDYTAYGGDRATIWQVDTLSYVPEPSSVLLLAGGLVAAIRRRRR